MKKPVVDPQGPEIRQDIADATRSPELLVPGQDRIAEAQTDSPESAGQRPLSAAVQNARGTALMAVQRVEEALECFREAIELDPDNAEAQYNEGGALLSLNRLDEATKSLLRGYALAPALPGGRLMLGMALLKLGRYREGWPHAEYFMAHRGPGEPRSILASLLPEWQGETLEDRSLVVQCDYGFGDAIQYVRFMPALKARGLGHVTLVCPPALKTLFKSAREIDTLKSTDEHVDLRKADYWCYLSSVPLRLDVTPDSLAAQRPYLSVRSAQIRHWGRRLERSLPAGLPRVGLVSAGKRRADDLHAKLMDERRSLPHVCLYRPLLALQDVAFVSLHKDPDKRAQWRELPEAQRSFDLMGDVGDFADTAALMRNLDLVVTTDTSIAHLAGALGTPCWVLLNFDCDWRWLHERTDSPWYPGTMRLFRQPEPGAWDAVIGEVAGALRGWVVQARAR
ncbi:tetratricopeptide repeat protein [Paraburkholderia dinghuensis]|uniref:Tetratricopeptide repeat protein n=1 Tax=Paraburkholderia dinghuensis TaxID=2305225 RepID=A0A3N6NJ55_9BURK|nr:tetratricopeptide repeat protein [Paraburkholderia dinghuensis]RQH09142.1 tetratricopeptide repeat protein [Paraburkholderia dinghuensis]